MSGLRERKKLKTQAAIVESAKRLFLSEGYAKTTMNDIAFDCDVGVGTLYNYYKSKAELLIEIFRADLPDLSVKVGEIQKNNSLHLRKKLHRTLSLFMDVFHQFPRSFYRELFAVISGQSENDREMFRGLFDVDQQSMSLVSEILEDGKKAGDLREDYAIDTSASLIYSAMVAQIMMFLFDEHVTQAQLKNHLLEQVDFLLDHGKN